MTANAVYCALARMATGRWLPAALLGIFAVSAIGSLVREGATFDEPAHLSAGYASLMLSDYRFSQEHPPLARLLCAIPLALAGASLPDPAQHDGWRRGDEWSFGYDFLYRTAGNDANTLLMLGRLPVVGLGVLLGLLVYAFAREASGEVDGRVALFCLAFSPSVLAHTRLVTTDVAMALFYLATIHATYKLGNRLSASTCTYLGIAIGMALSSKFSALLLLPITILLLAWRSLDHAPLGWSLGLRTHVIASRLGKAAALSLAFILAAGLALTVVWSVYGFRFAAAPSADLQVNAERVAIVDRYLGQHHALGTIVHTAKRYRLVPESFIDGAAYLAARSVRRGGYLLGERSAHGFAFYFPVAFAAKTPLPVVVLVIPAIASLLLGGPSRAWLRRCLGAGAVAYLAVSIAAGLNIGERHLLPLYPLLFIAIGSLSPWFDGTQARRWPLFALLGAWYVGAWASISPHYLAYFNELAGGPARGDRILVDSNLDWGQDVKGLGRWIQQQGAGPIPYSHFGTSRPQYYGIAPFISLPGASRIPLADRDAEWSLEDLQQGKAEYVAIHVTNLRGVYLPDTMTINGRRESIGQNYYRKFQDLPPVASIGHSINVYRNPWYRKAASGRPP